MTPLRTSRVFAAAAGAVLAYLLWKVFSPFWEPIAWAAIVAAVLHPGYRRLRRGVKRPNVAALLSTLLSLLLVVVPAVLLAVALLVQGARLHRMTTEYLTQHQVTSAADLMATPLLKGMTAKIVSRIPVSAAQVQQWILDGMKRVAGAATDVLSSAALGILSFLVSFFIMLFTLFFFFRDGEGLWRRLVDSVPLASARTGALVARLDAVFRAIVVGMLVTALVQGLLGGIGFAIFGLPSPVVFGALMFVLSLLPVGGTALVWLPAAIILMSQGAWGRGLGLAAWGALIVGLADNWLKPMIISGRSSMNTLPVFLGVMGGIAAFGFIGVFLGPLVIALALGLWEVEEEERARLKAAGAGESAGGEG
jgi:predicted PurR-regulated permease PerM